MNKILLALFLVTTQSAAAPVQAIDLYTGEAVVADQRSGERSRATPLALKQVLQKLSGLRNFEGYPELEPALENARAYMVSFHYREVETLLADGSTAEELRLVARFSKPEVDELMKLLQLPLWRPERRPTQVWVVVDDGLSRRIMPVELSYAWEAMDEVARQRGLDIVWPQADAEGNFTADPQLLWGGYTDGLALDPRGGVLIAASRREGPGWSIRVNLEYDGQAWTWRDSAMELASALAESIQHAVDEIAAVNSIAAADQGRWLHEITIRGLTGAGDYAYCLGYLQELSLVEDVTVAAAEPGTVRFVLQLNALPVYLDQALANWDAVQPVEGGLDYLLMR